MEAPGQGRWRPWSWRGAQRSWQVTSGSGWLTPRWVKDAVQGLGACTAPFAPSSASPGGCAFSFAPQCSPAGLWVSVSSPGSPDPPRLPRPLGTRDSRRLSDALQCLRALPRFAASRVSPSLLPWGGVSFPGRGGRALPPRGQGFGGRCLRCLTPPTSIPQATLPSQLKAFSPTVWPSVHRRPRSAHPGALETVDSVPFTEERMLGLSHDPGRPGASHLLGVGFHGRACPGQGSCRRLVTPCSSLLPSGPAQQLEALVAEPCCRSVAQSCVSLCDPMDCSTPGCPVFHQLPKLDVHGVSDAIQPSHPVSPPSHCSSENE